MGRTVKEIDVREWWRVDKKILDRIEWVVNSIVDKEASVERLIRRMIPRLPSVYLKAGRGYDNGENCMIGWDCPICGAELTRSYVGERPKTRRRCPHCRVKIDRGGKL